jgi:hypothetical protein
MRNDGVGIAVPLFGPQQVTLMGATSLPTTHADATVEARLFATASLGLLVYVLVACNDALCPSAVRRISQCLAINTSSTTSLARVSPCVAKVESECSS